MKAAAIVMAVVVLALGGLCLWRAAGRCSARA